MLFAKKRAETPDSSVGEDEDFNPLAGVTATESGFQIEAANDDDAYAVENQERVSGALSKLYTQERFHKHLCRLCGWMGRRKGLSSLQIDEGDDDFRAAAEVVYRRLVMRLGDRALSVLGNDALEDVIVLVVGFGPVFQGCMDEVAERRKARSVSRNVSDGGAENE